jgi:quercetin dioxygenase-like cupin family protein
MNPPVVADLPAPPAVAQILRNSCYNCHSNETKLAWFDQVAPAYWLVASDVKKARSHLNFSELGNAPKAQQVAFLFEAVTQIQFGAMPLPSYRLAHPESRVTPEQLAILKSYLESTGSHKVADAQAIAAANEQFAKWAGSPVSTATVQPALDGIEFPADYKNWKAISATDREDNGSLRAVLGNDVAIKAVQEGQTNPWPDGAKVAWHQLIGTDGTIRPGPFYQVEFMIKDSHTYAGTKGWGWARWLGTDLHPYGVSNSFTDSCVSCHLPMRGNDFVYTVPTITETSLPAGLHIRRKGLLAVASHARLEAELLPQHCQRFVGSRRLVVRPNNAVLSINLDETLDQMTPGNSTIPPDDIERTLAIARPNEDQTLRHIAVAGDTYTILLTGKETAGRYCLIDMFVPPGGGPPPHRHDFEEMFTILEGEIEATFRGAKLVVRAGETVNIPSNAPHAFRNRGDCPARLLCLCSPAGLETFFIAVGVPVASRTAPAPKLDPAAEAGLKAKVEALAAQYRTEILRP